jgi:predicted transcriptional regulator
MKTAKQEVRDILERLPDDASLEEIQYHIYVCQKVAKGEADVEHGRTLSQAEVENRLARWLGK